MKIETTRLTDGMIELKLVAGDRQIMARCRPDEVAVFSAEMRRSMVEETGDGGSEMGDGAQGKNFKPEI